VVLASSDNVKNTLYFGNNLATLRNHIGNESVNLVYLDPPFKSNQDYNILFREQDGTRAAAQIKAFDDTWEWNTASAEAFQDIVDRGGDVSLVMQAFRTAMGGGNDMLLTCR
jgi:site-specific DNA-methyltransferase (adenine-specific)